MVVAGAVLHYTAPAPRKMIKKEKGGNQKEIEKSEK
jgi:hypothetical protein